MQKHKLFPSVKHLSLARNIPKFCHFFFLVPVSIVHDPSFSVWCKFPWLHLHSNTTNVLEILIGEISIDVQFVVKKFKQTPILATAFATAIILNYERLYPICIFVAKDSGTKEASMSSLDEEALVYAFHSTRREVDDCFDYCSPLSFAWALVNRERTLSCYLTQVQSSIPSILVAYS